MYYNFPIPPYPQHPNIHFDLSRNRAKDMAKSVIALEI